MVVPLLLVLVLGIAEFGHAFQVQGTLSAAAREGARVMALQSDPAAARTAVRNAPPTLDPAITARQIPATPGACPTVGAGTTTARGTIAYPMRFLPLFCGASTDLPGRGVMGCNG